MLPLIQTPDQQPEADTINVPDTQQTLPDPPELVDHKATQAAVSQSSDPTELHSDYLDAHNQLESGNEDVMRSNLASEQVDTQQAVTKDLAREAALQSDLPMFDALMQHYKYTQTPEAVDNQRNISLEQGAVDGILNKAVTDPVQAKVLTTGDFSLEDHVRDKNIRQQILSAEYTKRAAKWDAEQSTFGLLTDAAGAFFPLLLDHTGNFPVQGEAADRLFAGSRQGQEARTLDQVPLTQYPDAVKLLFDNIESRAGTLAFNPSRAKEIAQAFIEKDPNEEVTNNVFSLMDVAAGADIGVSLLRGVKQGLNIARVAQRVGGAVESAELNAAKLSPVDNQLKDSVLKSVPINDAVNDSLPSGMIPLRELAGPNTPEKVAQSIAQIEEIGSRLGNIQYIKTLSPEEIAAVPEQVKNDLAKPLGSLTVADVRVVDNPNSSITQSVARIGKRDGLGWASEEAGVTSIVSKGFSPEDIKMSQAADGRWYGELTQAVDDSKFVQGLDLTDLTSNPVTQWYHQYIANPSAYLPNILKDNLASSTYSESYITKQVFQPLEKKMAIGKGSQKILHNVIEEYRDAEKDLSYNELRAAWLKWSKGKDITDKEVTAYYAAKQISNNIWTLANKGMYEDVARRGFKMVSIDNGATGFTLDKGLLQKGAHGKVVEGGVDPRSVRIYNSTDSIKYGTGELTPESLAKYKENGYQLVKLMDNTNVDKTPYKYILAHKGDINVRELDAIQLNYKQGTIGSRLYSGKWFVKQGVVRDFEDGTGKYVLNPKTHVASLTKNEAEAWAAKWEDARNAFLEHQAGKLSKDVAEAVIAKTKQIETIAEMEKLIQSGEIEAKTPFEVLYDRQKPSISTAGAHDLTEELNPMTEYYMSQGKAIFSPRGKERLAGPQDEQAAVLNTFAALSQGVKTATRSGAYDAFRLQAVDRWAKTARDLGVLKDFESTGLAFVADDPYVDNIPLALKGQLELIRKPIVRQFNGVTKTAEFFKEMSRSIGEWVEKGNLTGTETEKGIRNKLAPKLYDATSSNPLSAMRGIAFDLKLGLYNMGQLLIQSQTMFFALSVNPVLGAKAMAAAPWVRMALYNGTDSLAEHLATNKGIAAMHGMSPQEFKLYIKEIKESGITSVGGNAMYLDKYSNTLNYNKIQLGVNRVREGGRTFFYEAELWNRMVAHGMAWRELGEKSPGLAKDSLQARLWLKSRTDDLSNNMMSNSSAYWNKGFLSYPTQFLSYHGRFIDNVMPAFLGGSKRFTGAEKARMAAGQTLFYGAAGIPAGTWAYNEMNKALGRNPTEEEYKNATSGLFDNVLRNALNTDVDFANRIGEGAALSQVWHNIAQGNFIDVLFGPTGSIIAGDSSSVATSIRNIAKITSAGKTHSFDGVGTDAIVEAAKNISTFSNARKAYWMYNYQVYLSNTGKVLDSQQYSLGQELMTILSVPPREVSDASLLYSKNKDLSEGEFKQVQDLVRQKYITTVLKGKDDPKEYQRGFEQIQGLVAGLSNSPEQQRLLMQKINQGLIKDTEFNKLIQENLKLEGPNALNRGLENQPPEEQ